MRQRNAAIAAACLGVIGFASISRGQVVINEFQYDDTGTTDDREFVELYNSGTTAIDVSGWTLGGRDATGNNAVTTIPGAIGSNTTVIAPGAYYVIGNTAVANVNLVAAGGFLENDAETIELRSGAFAGGSLVDAVVYETNKGTTSHGVLPADVGTQVGGGSNSPGYWGNSQGVDSGTNTTTVSVGRYIDGRDTNNNGRDFGTRPATPGANNNAGGVVTTTFNPPNVDSLTVGTDVAAYRGSFVNAKVIDPTAISTFNQNAITASPQGGNAITVVDTTGGGNAAVSFDTFDGAASFNISAYLETADATTGESETSMYGLGQVGALFNVPDPEGDVVASTAPGGAADATGIGWMFQRFGGRAKLYLVDAGDGGNSDAALSPMEWNVISSIDLSSAPSGWHQLAIVINPDGTGFANFDGTLIPFTTDPNQVGEFYVGYRELLAGTPAAPGTSIFRPPTFDISTAPIPEPTSLALLGLGAVGLLARRRGA